MSTTDEPTTNAESPDGSGQSGGTPRRRRKSKKHLPVWQETILLLGIALVLAILIKALFVQAFYIPSESMEPGLVKNDRILVEKPSYWFDGPERGDVVVFKDPGGWLNGEEAAGPESPVAKVLSKVGLYPTGGHLVKRVIGVAGDTIECCDDQGRLTVNGQPLNEEDYARLGGAECYGPMVNDCSKDWEVGPIPDGRIFVMGDNRSNSADSSFHMCKPDQTDCTKNPYVETDDVVGKVFVLLWPSDRFEVLHRPDTFADVPDAG
ncbi:signal peptidase I [Nocardioides sp. YIM 152315]|uniref:signal peptidase I n=1 Tax=Nocardioides sp. YIM 152315 TaxID=3031760 RepID=UPI0023DBE420|nr:signal peptidase I [Nocardioides sp. YIM 152315]MDF1602807.1 signal peptidase I [Nocardioides sp. YIM 152315]